MYQVGDEWYASGLRVRGQAVQYCSIGSVVDRRGQDFISNTYCAKANSPGGVHLSVVLMVCPKENPFTRKTQTRTSIM